MVVDRCSLYANAQEAKKPILTPKRMTHASPIDWTHGPLECQSWIQKEQQVVHMQQNGKGSLAAKLLVQAQGHLPHLHFFPVKRDETLWAVLRSINPSDIRKKMLTLFSFSQYSCCETYTRFFSQASTWHLKAHGWSEWAKTSGFCAFFGMTKPPFVGFL